MCSRPVVLVVDDQEEIRDLLVEVLARRGYQAVAAGDGEQALAYLAGAATPPCVVLLDLMMPVLDGWQVLDRLRGADGQLSVPVVVLTAAAVPNVPRDVRVLPKPVSVDGVLTLVRAHCPEPT